MVAIMQSNIKFDQHMPLKKDKASETQEATKHILKQDPQEGRLLAYTSLCRPGLEYADTMWNPKLAKKIESEDATTWTVQIIARSRGQKSVTKVCSELGLQALKQRRKNHRLSSDENLTRRNATIDTLGGV